MLSGHSRIELGGDALVRFFVCVPVGALRHQKLDEARRERLLYSIFFVSTSCSSFAGTGVRFGSFVCFSLLRFHTPSHFFQRRR